MKRVDGPTLMTLDDEKLRVRVSCFSYLFIAFLLCRPREEKSCGEDKIERERVI